MSQAAVPTDPSQAHQDADALASVRGALLARCQEECARLLAEADEDAEEVLAEAERRAQEMILEAQRQGAADAVAMEEAALTRARRDARGFRLAAQREVYDELRGRVRERSSALANEPGYAEVRALLADRARALLGPEAQVRDDPAGGVVAESGSRRVSLTLPALADLVVARMGADLEALWRA